MTGAVVKGQLQREDVATFDGKTLVATRPDSTGGTTTGTRVNNTVDVKTVYGGTANVASLQKAIDSLGSSNLSLEFTPEVWTIDANVTVPSNFTMVVPAGCVFDISSGVTLTNNGVLFRQHATYSSGLGTFTQAGTDLLGSSSLAGSNTLCEHENLELKRNTVTTIRVTADAVLLETSGGARQRFTSVTSNCNLANTGADGRDGTENSGLEKASSWYHIWVIAKEDGTVATWATLDDYPGSGTDIYSDLPADYVYVGYVGAGYNDSGSDVANFHQIGSVACCAQQTFLNFGTATSITSVEITETCPPTAVAATGHVRLLSADSNGGSKVMFVASTSDSENLLVMAGARDTVSDGTQIHSSMWRLTMVEDSTIYYYVNSAGEKCILRGSGWEF